MFQVYTATSKYVISSLAEQTCIEMPYHACSSMPWKRTRLPTSSPALSNSEFEQRFGAILTSDCSKYTRFLLCMTYSPPCGGNTTQTFCRDACAAVQRDCEPLLRQRNIQWPSELACEKFPHKRSSCINRKALKKVKKHSKGYGGRNGEQSLKIVPRLPNCTCGDKIKLRKGVYLANKYDYAIRGYYISAQHISGGKRSGPLVLKMRVNQVLKHSKVRIPENSDVTLWVEEGCVCPRLRKKYEYLILCYEEDNRLLYQKGCMAVKWRKVWAARVKKWENILEKRQRRKKRRRQTTAFLLSESH